MFRPTKFMVVFWVVSRIWMRLFRGCGLVTTWTQIHIEGRSWIGPTVIGVVTVVALSAAVNTWSVLVWYSRSRYLAMAGKQLYLIGDNVVIMSTPVFAVVLSLIKDVTRGRQTIIIIKIKILILSLYFLLYHKLGMQNIYLRIWLEQYEQKRKFSKWEIVG